MAEAPLSPTLVPRRTIWQRKPPIGNSVNLRHPLAAGLEACWLFNEGQGIRLYDATGKGHHATIGIPPLSPTPHTITQWGVAEHRLIQGSALRMTANAATGSTGNLDRDVYTTSPAFSLEFWLAPSGTGTVMSGEDPFTGSHTLHVQTTAGGYRFAYQDPNNDFFVGPSPLALNTWVHIVLTREPNITASPVGRMHFTVNAHAVGSLTVNSIHPVLWSTLANGLTGNVYGPFSGHMALGRIWSRALRPEEIATLYRLPFGMFQRTRAMGAAKRAPYPPTQARWQAQELSIPPNKLSVPARMAYAVQQVIASGVLQPAVPVKMQWCTNLFHRVIVAPPSQMQWRAQRPILPVGLFLRDCGPEYEAALQRTAIAGDWIITAPAIGLYQSLNYNAGQQYEHRILDISDIEINAPPGGGIASVANVTVSLAETGRGQSIIALWEQASAVEAVEVTIDFLLRDASYVLRIFTGSIDSITVKDAVAQLVLTDASIHHNLVIPKDLVTIEQYQNADQAALTKAIPLLYGEGSVIGAAPLLYVDVPNNIYLVAAHPMQLGGKLAVYDPPNQTFLTLDSIVFIPNNGTATIALGTLTTGALRVLQDDTVGGQGTNAIDGNSATLTVVPTNTAGPNGNLDIPTGNGHGRVGWSPSAPGLPRTGTIKIDVTNHRRSPGSDPTTKGTFWVRTLNVPVTAVLRNLFRSPAFRHVTSAQNNTFIVSNINIGINEILEVVLVAECEGQIGGANQTYEVGEVSITPLVAFSANVSGSPTAIGLPVNIQELRFNPQQLALSVYFGSHGINPTHAIDGNSATWAHVDTSQLDSNLDGYGELIVIGSATSAQRGNNTVVIDLLRHRRNQSSDPTVTGTFSIQTYNTATGVLLRDNLFVTQAFRHATNPINTSYVATAINMGANTQLAVRVVARNEGGVGGALQEYEVGEIAIQSFYQPRGDSGDIFLFGPGYQGRTDVEGTVLDYLGSTPGRLFQTPDQVIASIYEQELGLDVDLPSFATAYSFFVSLGMRFDGGIGAGWAIEQTNARDILDALAKQSMSILFPAFDATWGIRPFSIETAVHQAFDGSNILTEEGAEGQRGEDRSSTVQLTMGNLADVYNHFEVRYKYNAGSKKYDRIYKVNKDGSNLPSSDPEKATTELSALTSWLRYGNLEPLIVEANWIADDITAAHYLHHLVAYFSQQRLTVQFETTFKAMCLQVGDFITVTDNSLPSGDNGGVFEVHTIRYRPLKGRIQLVASRVSSIPDVTIPPAPTAAVGCARLESPGMLACWDFEEASGTRTDHLYEYALTAVNAPLGVTGKVGNAAQFLRANSQALINDDLFPGVFTGAFTLSCWVRLLSPVSEGWILCAKGSDLNLGLAEFYLTILSPLARPRFVCGTSHANTVTSTTSLPFTGSATDWTLVRCWRTFDANFNGSVMIQVNNGSVESTSFTNTLPTAHAGFTIGAGYAGSVLTFHANLLLDSLMFWNRVLSQTELDAIWNGGAG